MTITLNELLIAQPVLNKLRTLPFRGRQAFLLAKIIKAVGEEMTGFDDSRNNILIKYCDKDENGEAIVNEGQVHIKDDVLVECNAEIQELLTTEIEMPFAALPIDWFDEVDLSANDMAALMPFIEE